MLEVQRMRNYYLEAGPFLATTPRVQLGTAYGVALTYAVILHGIVTRCFDTSTYMLASGIDMLTEILVLAEDSRPYRPLGSSAMLTMLIAAWPLDLSMRSKIEALLDDYTSDFPMARWQESATWLDSAMYGSLVENRAVDGYAPPNHRPEAGLLPQMRDSEIRACAVM